MQKLFKKLQKVTDDNMPINLYFENMDFVAHPNQIAQYFTNRSQELIFDV